MPDDPDANPPARSWRELPTHRRWLDDELLRLVSFAAGAREEHGFGWLDERGAIDPSHPPQLWIAARMTHLFAVGHLLGLPGCGPLADHGLTAIRDVFEDRVHGGWLAEGDQQADPGAAKSAYPHVHVLLAAASAAIAGRPAAPAALERGAAVVSERFWSETEGAVVEDWDRAFTVLDGYRGANANMHGVEAFLAAGDATGDGIWYQRSLRIAERLIDDVARRHGWRIIEHFDERWTPLPDYNADDPGHRFRPYGATPGHALEWSRLLVQLHTALGSAAPAWLVEAAEALFARALEDGWREPGGIVYTTGFDGSPVVAERLHWPVAEAIAAATVLHVQTGRPAYETWYRRACDFAERYLIDRTDGSWHPELDAALAPSHRIWHGKPDVYHAFQAVIIPWLPLRPSVAGAAREWAAGPN